MMKLCWCDSPELLRQHGCDEVVDETLGNTVPLLMKCDLEVLDNNRRPCSLRNASFECVRNMLDQIKIRSACGLFYPQSSPQDVLYEAWHYPALKKKESRIPAASVRSPILKAARTITSPRLLCDLS
ncbi:hypothetical protein TNCV_231061 [Trichonephila clavipes]|nr:hypothetical protein TNCV_231061 [Trichonephila clavipes]